MKKKISTLQLILTVLSVTALLISNIVSAKQFQLPLGISMTGAVIVFPITYILSDLFSEVYGYKYSRMTCYLGFAMNLLIVVMFQISIALPASSIYSNQSAYETVLGNTPRMLIASFIAYILGDFVNDRIFRNMKKKKQGMDGFAGRAILSSIFGELFDSTIFVTLAFTGSMSASALLKMMVCQAGLKIAYEIIIVPLTTLITKKVKNYEGIAI